MKGLYPLFVTLTAVLYSAASGGTSESVDFSRINPDRLPYRFEVRRFLGTVNEFFAADIDGDAVDEIVTTILKDPAGTAPYAVEVDGIGFNEVRFRCNFTYPAMPSAIVADVEDRDGDNEIFVQEVRPEGVLFHILNSKGGKVFSTEVARKPRGADKTWECGVSADAAMDVNRDGYLDLVTVIYTTYGYQPREVCVLDVRNRRWLWKFPVGFGFTGLVLADVNSDGSREIILGSTSPGNIESSGGKSVNGTDDLHIYLTVLDSLGRRLHSQQVGGVFEGISVFARDINGDGKSEILARSDCHSKPKVSGRIALWNPETGVLGPQIAPEKNPAKNIDFLDADRDGKTDFAAGWDDGTVEIYNGRFEMLSSLHLHGFNVQGLHVSDLNRDGEEDLLVTGLLRDEHRILALDRKLRLLAVYDKNAGFNPFVECVADPGFGQDKLLIAQGGKGVSSGLLSLERNVLPAFEIPWKWLAGGALAGMLAAGVLFAIRARRREEECASIRNLADSIHMGLFILDAEGRLLFMNREMEHFLGGRRVGRDGRPFTDVLKDTPYEPVIPIIRGAFQKNRRSVEEEARICEASGEYREILVGVSPISLAGGNQGSGRLVLIQNITEVAESKRAVVWASIAQRLAHEIKTPLSSVMLSAQRIRMECENRPEELNRYEKYIGHITGQVDRLRKMTDAFMKFARVEKPQMAPCDVREILEEVIAESRLKIGSGIQVKIQWDQKLPRISADRQQLSVAFQNLIDNSLNAMEGRGNLTLSARLVQSLYNNHNRGPGDGIQIEISDTGRGIARKHLNRLFQPFYSKSPSGTGLGLVIVKKIIEEHRGLIRIESEEGIGTTVFITLPVNNGKNAS